MNLVFVLLLSGVMYGARTFSAAQASATVGTSLALGYLLLTAYFAGNVFKSCRLPKLTGYIVAGLLVGPEVLGLLSQPQVGQLKLVNGVAIALIALTAGSELTLKSLAPLLRTIAWITAVAVVGTALLLGLSVYLLQAWLPFLEPLSQGQRLSVALVLGVVMAAQSPAVVIALRDEMKAKGTVSQTVLGVVVLADLVVIVLFALSSSLARSTFGAGGGALRTLASLSGELAGSALAGLVGGVLLAAYLRFVQRGAALFIVAAAFVLAEVGQSLGLDTLLVALGAGLFVRNATSLGPALHREIESASLPVYVVFFAVAGTTLHVDALLTVGFPLVLFIAVRAAGLLFGARLGGRLAGAPEPVVRYAGFGLLPQAGLALALSLMFVKTFPEFGASAAALTFGVVAVNELICPALYRFALVKSGEANQADEAALPAALESGGERG